VTFFIPLNIRDSLNMPDSVPVMSKPGMMVWSDPGHLVIRWADAPGINHGRPSRFGISDMSFQEQTRIHSV